MAALKIFLIFAIYKSAMAEIRTMVPCDVTDVECLTANARVFLERSRHGIPYHKIRPIDPLVIPELVVDFPNNSAKYDLKNVSVTGLKDEQITDFKLNVQNGSAEFTAVIAVLSFTARDFLKKADKSGSAINVTSSNVRVNVKYSVSVKTSDVGVNYFVVGPETLLIDLSDDTKDLTLDAASKAQTSDKKSDQLLKLLLKEVVREAYATVFDNLRQVAKILPVSQFFTHL